MRYINCISIKVIYFTVHKTVTRYNSFLAKTFAIVNAIVCHHCHYNKITKIVILRLNIKFRLNELVI